MEDMKKDILELQGKLSDSIELIEKSTKKCMYSDSHHGHLSEPNFVDYFPSRLEDTTMFLELLYNELELRG